MLTIKVGKLNLFFFKDTLREFLRARDVALEAVNPSASATLFHGWLHINRQVLAFDILIAVEDAANVLPRVNSERIDSAIREHRVSILAIAKRCTLKPGVLHVDGHGISR